MAHRVKGACMQKPSCRCGLGARRGGSGGRVALGAQQAHRSPGSGRHVACHASPSSPQGLGLLFTGAAGQSCPTLLPTYGCILLTPCPVASLLWLDPPPPPSLRSLLAAAVFWILPAGAQHPHLAHHHAAALLWERRLLQAARLATRLPVSLARRAASVLARAGSLSTAATLHWAHDSHLFHEVDHADPCMDPHVPLLGGSREASLAAAAGLPQGHGRGGDHGDRGAAAGGLVAARSLTERLGGGQGRGQLADGGGNSHPAHRDGGGGGGGPIQGTMRKARRCAVGSAHCAVP